MIRALVVGLSLACSLTHAQPAAPVEVEPGERMGPIRIGMSAAELHALGLAESDEGSRGHRYGPYLVQLDDHGSVRRIEVQLRDLGRPVRISGHVFEIGTDIHQIRDALGDCEWQEGGGEIYLCAHGALSVRTTHSLRPERYTLVVLRRR